ncbi:MAG: hypothetical protein Q4C53_04140 [Clostridia bacterium]|nr:hypothetical protein [Clostridia bacterium]
MRSFGKTLRLTALLLALFTVLCGALPVMADTVDQGSMSFNAAVNEETTFDLVVASPGIAVSSITVNKSENCGILSTLRGSCVTRGDRKVFTLTVKANAGGTARFDYTYSYTLGGESYTYVTHVTLNVKGPTPGPATPVVSLTAGPQNAQTGACTLTANLSGCSNYTYEWYRNTSDSTSGGTLVNGGKTSSSTITLDCGFQSSMTEDYYYYYLVVGNGDNGGNPVYSKVIRLINPYSSSYRTPSPAPSKDLPVITKHPTSEVVEAGDSAAFVAKADKYDTVTWYFTDGDTNFKASKVSNYISGISVSGYSTGTLKLSKIPVKANGFAVYAVFTNAHGSVETDRAYIHVGADIPAVSISAGGQDPVDGTCTLTAKFSGCSRYAYKWFVNTSNSVSGATLLKESTTSSNSVSREVTFKSTKTDPYYYLFIKVWNADASEEEAVYSNAIKLANPYSRLNPVITKHPSGESVSSGDSTSFIARADNYDTVTWYFTKGGDTIKASKASSRFSGLKVSGYAEEKLKLSKIPSSLNGWSVFATFENADGQIDTKSAKIYVDSNGGDDDDDYDYTYTYRPTAIPTATPYSVTPVPALPTPTPTLTPHIHAYGTKYESDSSYHWHACECGDQGDFGTHQFTYYNSSTKKGVRVGVCSVCGYMTEEAVAATTSGGMSMFTKIMIFLGILFLGAVGVLVYVMVKEKQRKEAARKEAARRRRQQQKQHRTKKKTPPTPPAEGYPFDDDFQAPEADDPFDTDDDGDEGPFNLFDD